MDNSSNGIKRELERRRGLASTLNIMRSIVSTTDRCCLMCENCRLTNGGGFLCVARDGLTGSLNRAVNGYDECYLFARSIVEGE